MIKKPSLLFCFLIFISCEKKITQKSVSLQGSALGTSFHIKYFDQNEINYSDSIDSLFTVVNQSLSTYLRNSDISRINDGDSTVVVDHIFLEVFDKSKRIYRETDGFFDPTIGTLVDAWGFGFGQKKPNLDSLEVSLLLEKIGFDKVIIVNNLIKKEQKGIRLDFNSIGKGYTVDLIGRFFENKNIENYIIEIGGEIRAKGKNLSSNKLWNIAIDNPNFDSSRKYKIGVFLEDESMATSGNYRKFTLDENGDKLVHIINPKTGMAKENDLLSASVIGKLDCADVDAYATAFMAMGFEKTIKFLENHSELKVFLIYIDNQNKTNTYKTLNLTTHEF